MSSFDDAIAAIRNVIGRPLGSETVAIAQAYGRTLPHDVAAPLDVPAFDRSAMDGYAVRSADLSKASLSNPVGLRVAGATHAGDAQLRLPPGQAIQIATGGVLPIGADAIVPVEEARSGGSETAPGTDRQPVGASILVSRGPDPGAHVSARGSDIARGSVIAKGGIRLGPAEIGVLTSVGFTEIRATRRPRVAILPSGSEIVEPGRDLRPGEVYNSNAAALRALVLAAGGDPMVHPAVEDTFDAHDRALAQAAQAADLIVTTGGTSVGERDYLSSVIEQRGRVLVHGVRLRPGKPTLVGSLPCPGKTGDDPGLGPGSPEVPMLGLPGYPASALVTGELFAVEAVRRLLGSRRGAGLAFLSRWRDDVSVRPDVTTLVPVKHEGGAVFSIYKESGALTSLAGSDGYALFPEGSKSPKAGSVAEVHAWSWQSAF